MEAGDREEFLTVAQVAETLQLNQQTVRNWIDQGSLPALRVGRRVRIRSSDFERLLANGSIGPSGAASAVDSGPSAEDFWGGEPVGLPDPRAREEDDGGGSPAQAGSDGSAARGPEGSAEHPADGSAEHPPDGSAEHPRDGSAEHLGEEGG